MTCIMSFNCEKCNYSTSMKHHYNAHLLSKKHLQDNEEITNEFSCHLCDYNTKVKQNYDNHLKCNKHFRNTRPSESQTNSRNSAVWAKYCYTHQFANQDPPEEWERELLFKFFEREWEIFSTAKPRFETYKEYKQSLNLENDLLCIES